MPTQADPPDRPDLPVLVQRAQRLAQELGFPLSREQATTSAGVPAPSACLPGVGRFLAVLAAGCAGGLIGEYGSGSGVGTAWLASSMPATCQLVTVEVDEVRAEAVRTFFAADQRVTVVTGDAAAALPDRGPFDLVFADCGIRDDDAFAAVVGLLKPGGRVVMDDVTPLTALGWRTLALPEDSPYRGDDVKRRFFARPELVSVEVVLPDLENSLLVGTKVAASR